MRTIARKARGLVWRFGSLRLRVVAAFVILLSVTLAVAGTQIYLSTRDRLIEEIDLDLYLAANQALVHLEEQGGRYVFQGGAVQLLAFPGEKDLEISVLSPAGERWDHAGTDLPVLVSPSTTPFTLEISGQDWRTLAQPIVASGGQVQGWAQAVRSLKPVENALAALATQLYLILPVAVLLAAIASYFLAGRALRPLARMADMTEQIGPTTLDKRIDHYGPPDEVGRMAAAFDAMLDRVQTAFERERRFSADASHELRTPLAVIKSGIGVTLSRRRTVDEHETTLQDLDAQVDQLIRLCDDLLVLARGGRPRSTDSESVDLTSLLELVVEQFIPLAEERKVTVLTHIRKRLTVTGFPDDLIRLFVNLLGNAVKFTPPGGVVTMAARRHHRNTYVSVSDTGPGIPASHLPHIFEPFYRIDPSRSKAETGTGLGLAIAHEIAGAHGGTIKARSKLGEGTTFEVTLPASRSSS
jgi:heavy metal sensor kinase